MPCIPKLPAHTAAGYWGRSIYQRVSAEATPQKERCLFQDELRGTGLKAELWQAVHDVRYGEIAATGTLRCSCVKASGQQADRRCLSCHGIGYTPGYRKFGYTTIYAASISSGLVLSNVALNTTLKPYRIELVSGALTGTITTVDTFFIRNYMAGLWDYANSVVIKNGTASTVLVEYSVDSGLTWSNITLLATANPGTGPIRFRITLARTSTSVASPSWEILRVRFPTLPVDGRMGSHILVLRSVSPNKLNLDLRGVQIDSTSNMFWTAPLSFFDSSIVAQQDFSDTIDEADMIREPAFIEWKEGPSAAGPVAERWCLTSFTQAAPLGYFVRQYFQARLQQQEEWLSLVW